jgi:hypothetical protein
MTNEEQKILDEILAEANKHTDDCQCSDCYHAKQAGEK